MKIQSTTLIIENWQNQLNLTNLKTENYRTSYLIASKALNTFYSDAVLGSSKTYVCVLGLEPRGPGLGIEGPGLGIEGPGLGIEGPGLGLGLKNLALTTSLNF